MIKYRIRIAVIVMHMSLVVMSANAQARFDVASVKPCAPNAGPTAGGRGGGGSRNLSTAPGRLSITCMTVEDLLNVAYVQSAADDPLTNDSGGPFDATRVKGGPAWAHSARFSIEAKTENSPLSVAKGAMLQALLEDRFQLKTHRELEEVPIYSLVVAKSGMKLKRQEELCTPYVVGMPYSDPSLAPDGKPWCPNRSRDSGQNRIIESAGQEMSGLVKMLSGALDRRVIDATGIKGQFSFHLEFVRDEKTSGRGGPPPPDAALDVTSGASIFTALDQQLGLRLVPGKGSHGVIVIDRAELPSGN